MTVDSQIMDFDEANRIIRDPDAPFVRHAEAAFVLTASENSSYQDLLECLNWQGIAAESGAIQLYIRTKRPRENDSIDSFVVDYNDWKQYLIKNKFIKA